MLPNGHRAVIPPSKLTDYLLNENHPTQPGHAVLFRTLLGIDITNGHLLRDALLHAAANQPAVVGERSAHGQKYEVRFSMTGHGGAYTILSIWIIAAGDDIPRLATAFIE